MEKYLRVGVISSSHGVRGEAKVFPTTDDVQRFKKLKTCILDTGREYKELHIESVKFFNSSKFYRFICHLLSFQSSRLSVHVFNNNVIDFAK